ENTVPGLCPATGYATIADDLADRRHADDERTVPNVCIAAGNGDLEHVGEFGKPDMNAFCELDAASSIVGNGHECRKRAGGHRSQITQIDRQGLPADLLRPSCCDFEMTTFQQHVRGNNTPGIIDAQQYGGIVT